MYPASSVCSAAGPTVVRLCALLSPHQGEITLMTIINHLEVQVFDACSSSHSISNIVSGSWVYVHLKRLGRSGSNWRDQEQSVEGIEILSWNLHSSIRY